MGSTFKEVEEFIPTRSQEIIIHAVGDMVNLYIKSMMRGSRSGKTTVRKMLCNRIMTDDRD